MKKRSLKLLSIVLTAVLLVAMFGGCAKKVDDTDNDGVGYPWEDAQYRSELASEFGPNTRPYYDEEAGEFDIEGYFASRGWDLGDSDGCYGTYILTPTDGNEGNGEFDSDGSAPPI